MAFPKRPYTFEDIAKMNAELHRYNKEVEKPPIQELRAGAKSSDGRKLYGKGKNFIPFASQSPEVRARAQERLDYLLIKHRAKLEEKGPSNYYGILCGVAVAMAKRDLGLVMGYKEMGWKWLYRKRRRNALRTALGLQGHKSWDMTHRIPEDKPKLQVAYTSLEGI